MRAAVVGQGYVGLVSAAGLAELGHEVVGIEADAHRLTGLRNGRLPIHEPGLEDLVARHSAAGRLRFTSVDEAAISSAHVVMVAVGTTDPYGGWQTQTLTACLSEVVPHIADDAVLVVRSTLPPDFIGNLAPITDSIRESAGRSPIPVLLNPEFTRESTAVSDFLAPDRVVIGVGQDPHGRGVALLRRLYGRIEAPILVQGIVDACLAKLGANLFLATKISFANELASLCDAYGATVDEVVSAMAFDKRIGGSFLRAGVGFGGSCLPHQVTMTVTHARRVGLATPLIAAVDEVNARQRSGFVGLVVDLLGGSAEGARVAILGLTFKPGTDDIREAPSLEIAARLIEAGATVVAYDPMVKARVRASAAVPGLQIAASAEDALAGADIAGLVTEWPEFDLLDWEAVGASMNQRLMVDGRNALSWDRLLAAGITCAGFGRGVARPMEVPATVEAPAQVGFRGLVRTLAGEP